MLMDFKDDYFLFFDFSVRRWKIVPLNRMLQNYPFVRRDWREGAEK